MTEVSTYDAFAESDDGERELMCAETRFRAVEVLTAAMNDCGISSSELAARLNRSPSAISQVLGGDRNLTLDTFTTWLFAIGHEPVLSSRRRDGVAGVDDWAHIEHMAGTQERRSASVYTAHYV